MALWGAAQQSQRAFLDGVEGVRLFSLMSQSVPCFLVEYESIVCHFFQRFWREFLECGHCCETV
ncbi:MAG: hypothetical protein ACFB51_08840, partial [Anaerolineae bacterium]